MSSASVRTMLGSARKVMFVPAMRWFFAHASITAASLTQ